MSRSIILWRNHREQSTDDAGTSITSSVLAPPIYFTPGPYEESDSATTQGGALRYVPSLSYFCIKILTESPEQVHPFGAPRLVYQPPASPEDYDILRALIPSYYPSLNGDFGINGFKIGQVDPRLWAVLIQLFVGLPDVFSTYLIALSDKHLPLLQHIPATTHFSLLTVVDLHGSPHLTDDTILELRALHGLVALDASETTLTAQGIRRLSGTLLWTDDGEIDSRRRRGPWQLRILRLRNCRKVGNLVLEHLEAFPLLTVVDLRGTQCRPTNRRFPKSFRPATDRSLFHPTALLQSLCSLSSSHTIFSSDNPYVLYVDRLHYSRPTSRYSVKSSVVGENTFVATMPTLPHSIPSSISSAKQFVSGSSDVLLRQETRERQQRLDDAYEAVRCARNELAEAEGDLYMAVDYSDNDGNDSNDDDNNDDDDDDDSPVHRAMLIRDRLETLDRAKSLLASVIQENGRGKLQPGANGFRYIPSTRPLAHSLRQRIHAAAVSPSFLNRQDMPRHGPLDAEGRNVSRPMIRAAVGTRLSSTGVQTPGILSVSTPTPRASADLGLQATATVPPIPAVLSANASIPDSMGAVAFEEAQADASRQAARSFYTPALAATSTRTPTPETPRTHAYETSFASNSLDPLMLYREPPPWSLLCLPPTPSNGPVENREQSVSVNKADGKARKHVESMSKLLATAAKRQRIIPRHADGFPNQHAGPVASRNPFAQRLGGKAPSEKETALFGGAASTSASGFRPSNAEMPPPVPLTPLRPISTLEVPLLPKTTSSAVSDYGKRHIRSASLAQESTRNGSVPTTFASSAHLRSASGKGEAQLKLKLAEPATLRKAPRDTSAAAAASRTVRRSTSASSPQQSKAVLHPKGKNSQFDWGKWAS